jgi:hypothetical protein
MDLRHRFRRALLAAFTIVCAACVLAPGLAQAGTLDQQQTAIFSGAYSIGTNQAVAQTFTAGLTGKIDQVDLHIDKSAGTTADLTVEIRSVSGIAPADTALASTSVPASAISVSSAFVPVTFASQASVVAGTQYAIVASSTTPVSDTYSWTESPTPAPYAGGGVFYKPPPPTGSWASVTARDLAFRTYVVLPPVPAATGQRAAALKKCKKKRSRHKRKKCRTRAKKLPL